MGPIDLEQVMHSGWRQGVNKEGDILVTGIRSEHFGIGVSDSLQLYYYDGKLKQVMRIANGQRNGLHIEFNDDGSIYFTGNVLNGKGEGVYKAYDDHGKLERVTVLFEGTKVIDLSKKSLDSLLVSRDK